jgi:hypothetical protein
MRVITLKNSSNSGELRVPGLAGYNPSALLAHVQASAEKGDKANDNSCLRTYNNTK